MNVINAISGGGSGGLVPMIKVTAPTGSNVCMGQLLTNMIAKTTVAWGGGNATQSTRFENFLAYETYLTANQSHKYYVRYLGYVNTSIRVGFGARYWDSSNNFLGQTFDNSTQARSDYTSFSVLVSNLPSNIATIEPCIQYLGESGTSTTAYWKKCCIIDLTETFGSGQEPTKEWCDTNIIYTTDDVMNCTKVGTEVSGTWTFSTTLGTHTILATLGTKSETQSVLVDRVGIYPITITYPT